MSKQYNEILDGQDDKAEAKWVEQQNCFHHFSAPTFKYNLTDIEERSTCRFCGLTTGVRWDADMSRIIGSLEDL